MASAAAVQGGSARQPCVSAGSRPARGPEPIGRLRRPRQGGRTVRDRVRPAGMYRPDRTGRSPAQGSAVHPPDPLVAATSRRVRELRTFTSTILAITPLAAAAAPVVRARGEKLGETATCTSPQLPASVSAHRWSVNRPRAVAAGGPQGGGAVLETFVTWAAVGAEVIDSIRRTPKLAIAARISCRQGHGVSRTETHCCGRDGTYSRSGRRGCGRGLPTPAAANGKYT